MSKDLVDKPGRMADTPLHPPYAWIYSYNEAACDDERRRLLVANLASLGSGAVVRAPFFCDLGGNISLGEGAFLNFNCVILDVVPVTIGAFTAIGPGVQILTSDHPRDPALRRQQVRYGRPVSIGDNVWVGAGAIILPGVSVGEDAIIGAGSVVTRNVAAGATVAGSPARPIGAGTRAT